MRDFQGSTKSAVVSKQTGQRAVLCLLATAYCLLSPASAQDPEPPPSAPGAKGAVRITFLPPPMEGTLSLGIYDKAGKLVRILAREAAEKDFTVGLNGLIANWDGSDDAGKPLAPGTYGARGYAAGELDVEGVATHGNDWIIDDDSPHVRRIVAGTFAQTGAPGGEPKAGMLFQAETADGKPAQLVFDTDGKFVRQTAVPEGTEIRVAPAVSGVVIRDGKALVAAANGKETVLLSGAESVIAADRPAPQIAENSTKPGSIWVIDQTENIRAVKQFSPAGEFLRRLQIEPGDPQPVRISASPFAEEIMLVEENAETQRVRVLRLEAQAPDAASASGTPVSNWKTVFSKSITASPALASVADKLGRAQPFTPEGKFSVRLLANPLLKGESTQVSVNVGFDAMGSFLQTSDGLPLRRITATPNLKWAVIGHEGSGKQLTILQSDGAVVEEFRMRKLANMMAFDAGDYEWLGSREPKTEREKSADETR